MGWFGCSQGYRRVTWAFLGSRGDTNLRGDVLRCLVFAFTRGRSTPGSTTG